MIELRNINFRYAGGTDAGGLVNIDLIIPDGQVILLCGQSGCGKTTLTRLVNGLIPNYYEGELSGEVLLYGKNISRLPLYETAKYVGSVFQNPRTQFFTVDSTSELAFGCENQGLPEEEIIQRVKSTAEQFDMDNLLGKNIFSLSGGEKQKIACASVSASNPPIIGLGDVYKRQGHNGAGKSTLARCLCGLEKHCKGIVKVDGKTYNRKQRLSLCYMVMQDVNHQLFTESTEEEMLISMAEPAPDKADAVLDRLDLLQFKERHPMALSGGQKQRVAIATALVSDRKILVLDEPTSGLDLQHMKEVADELITIQEMGKTSLVITHDYELIVSCCTHVLHLEHGVVQEQYALDAAGLQLLKSFFIESR